MKKPTQALKIAFALLGLLGCNMITGSTDIQHGEFVQSKKERIRAPVIEGDQQELVAGNTAFALELYRQLKEEDGNLFYSPYSISLALAMTYAGADGETEAQIAQALHFTLPQGQLHPAFNALDLLLAGREEAAGEEDSKGNFRLNIANSIWGQEGYEFLPAFLDVLAENYGAGLRLMDFLNAPDDSRQAINDWVSEETEGKIKDLIPPGALTPMTRLVLANAIYFNASWQSQFDEDATEEASFTLLDGSQISVPMMNQTEWFGYAAGEGYQAVELPYEGGQMSMVILLPDTGDFEDFESNLEAVGLQTILTAIEYQRLVLSMPKFSFDAGFSLVDPLRAMGMGAPFSPGEADFSGMDGTRDLFISGILHKAFVAVDEQGTEAAAATAVIMAGTSAMPDEPMEVKIDRPFIFLIRDVETGAILFIGRVLNPAG